MNKKAISFVEIIIAVAIIALLATIGLSYRDSYNDNKFNTKIEADLATLNNSFLAYKQENGILPTAKSNDNYFKIDSSYAHDENDDAFGVHGYVTEDLIPKKYLNYLPLDPRTNQFYAYGKTLNSEKPQFEFAGVITKNGESQSIVSGSYDGKEMVGLIREYNGPQFIFDKSTQNFPFNPIDRLMTAKIGSYSGSISLEINGNTYTNDILDKTLTTGNKIKVNGDGYANIYYSDGSRSTLEKDSELVLTNMSYKTENNLFTKIQLTLENGTIWTKATKLNQQGDKSEFEITANDATAAVRGTIFKVEKSGIITNLEVLKGAVDFNNSQTPTAINLEIQPSDTQAKILMAETNTPIYNTPYETPTTFINKEPTLPSNIKPQITKVDSTSITIAQAGKGYYIKSVNPQAGATTESKCDSNGKCDLGNLTEFQLCTKIGVRKESCSDTIKVNNEIVYIDDGKTKEEKDIKEIEDSEREETGYEDNEEEDAVTSCSISGIAGILNASGKCEITQTLTQPSSGFTTNSYPLGATEEYDIYINGTEIINEENGTINIYYYYNGNLVIKSITLIGYSGNIELSIKEH